MLAQSDRTRVEDPERWEDMLLHSALSGDPPPKETETLRGQWEAVLGEAGRSVRMRASACVC
jgi:hypothetical protein